MPLSCPHCNRINPDDALYCCHDGAALGDGAHCGRPVAVGVQPFANPFVFPSGRFCRNFDELVLACEEHWDEARDLLREGLLEGFFVGLGRADLAWAADQCAEGPDADLALDELLTRLPGAARRPPRLVVRPPEINAGSVTRDADHPFVVHLLNEGMGLLRGSVVCVGAEWLVFGQDAGAPDKVFQLRHDQAVPVRIIGRRLRAGSRTQEGRLVVESNGGSAVVLVRVEAPAVAPFLHGVLAGADSPRRLAEMARAAPREAAAFFEDASIAHWYDANGWTYPVQGPRASGVAALQQFYEALGLAAPPRVELEQRSIHLEGPPGAPLEAAVVVQTSERRAVFAHATSAVPWLHIDRAVLSGRTARIPVRVPAIPGDPGERLQGQIQVTANGNQRFTVEVALAVTGAEPAPDPMSAPARNSSGRPGLLAWLLAGAFLLLAGSALAAVLTIVALKPGDDPPPAPANQGRPTPKTDAPQQESPPTVPKDTRAAIRLSMDVVG